MKKLKFRAWDIESKQICKVLEMQLDTGHFCIEVSKTKYGLPLTVWRIMREDRKEIVLMQYTGGYEMWEGDVVRWDNGDEAIIEFAHNAFILKWKGIQRETEWDYMNEFVDGAQKVIGNIHENPELLENNHATPLP